MIRRCLCGLNVIVRVLIVLKEGRKLTVCVVHRVHKFEGMIALLYTMKLSVWY